MDKYGEISNWDVSNDVTNMSRLFFSAHSFNQPLNNWNVPNVTNMNHMFWDATSFNQPLMARCLHAPCQPFRHLIDDF